MEEVSRLELDEDQIASSVWSERARVFNDRLVASVFVSPLGIGLAAWLQYLVAGWERALMWAAMIGSVEVLILLIGSHFKRSAAAQENPSLWVNSLAVCSGLLGVMWGASVWFVWSEDRFLFYITSLCVLVGVSNICMVVMSPVRRAIGFFSIGIMLPPLVQMGFINNPIALQIGVGWVVMLIVQTRYAGELRRELIRQLDSSARNVALVGLLSRASLELSSVNAEMESKNTELHRTMEQLNQLVTFDQLTGAFSRRFILEELERQVSQSSRHAAPVSLIMFDLDHFKAVNDSYGHEVGDRALREASRAARAQLRDGDMLARIGGEEFLILLPMTNQDAATLLAERLRTTLAATSISEGGQDIFLPASFGVAELVANEDFTTWFRRVDSALYQAKANGRNTLVVAQ
jgi:diguanylate cyclase (GGDEF)-like protein